MGDAPLDNPGLLDRKVILIVGGTSGMGLAATTACLAAGAKVVAVGLAPPEQTLSAEQQQRLRVIIADAREADTAVDAVRLAIRHFGRLDGLYHVAGGSGRSWGDGPLHELEPAGWDATLDLNLSSVFHSNRAAIRQFLHQGEGGTILNLSSVLATRPAPEHFATHAYAAAKAAIIGLTRTTAAYYAPHRIRVNALLPGLVNTPMAQRAAENPLIMAEIKQRQALDGGRIGAPGDLDAAVVFFLSDQSRFVTGQALAVDGGWSVR